MRRVLLAWGAIAVLGAAVASVDVVAADPPEWVSLFDGKTLEGWKVAEHPDSVTVHNGAIVTHGPRAHVFYVGPVHDHDFKNFELKMEVKTEPGSNSGIYFHTQYQEEGWPDKGYESQVNNSHTDWRRTGGLYAVEDVKEAPAKDGEWFTYEIRVEGRRIITRIDGKTIVDYTEPEGVKREDMPGRVLSHGTFALQCHDPKSVVYFRNIEVRALPD